jgi:hypothetical protein
MISAHQHGTAERRVGEIAVSKSGPRGNRTCDHRLEMQLSSYLMAVDVGQDELVEALEW